METPQGPYGVEQIETATGPRWRLAGPGLNESLAYPWEEFRDKLAELAEVMNFAYQQGVAHASAATNDNPVARKA